MPTPFGRSHCPLQSGYFDSSCAAALVIAVANARKTAIAAVGLWRGCMATSEEHTSKRKNTTQRTRCESFSDCRDVVLEPLLRAKRTPTREYLCAKFCERKPSCTNCCLDDCLSRIL